MNQIGHSGSPSWRFAAGLGWLWRDELDGAAEAEAEGLLQRDVEEAELLELLGAAEGADVNGSEITVGDELRHLLLGGLVVAGDEDVELLAGDLAGDQGGAKVLLKAFTTGVPCGTSCWTSSAEEVPGGVPSLSQVWVSTGLVMSTTTLPASWSPYCWTASLIPG
jgi:hypothetical protein